MKMKSSNYLFILLCLMASLSSPALLFCEEPMIQASLGAISLDDEIKDLKVVSSGQVNVINTVYPNTRNGVFSYRGSKKLTFFREKPAVDPDQDPIRIPVAEVELDGKHSRYLLFFTKKSGDAEHIRFFLFPIRRLIFRLGVSGF